MKYYMRMIFVLIAAVLVIVIGMALDARGQVGQIGIGGDYRRGLSDADTTATLRNEIASTASDSNLFKTEDSGNTITPKNQDTLKVDTNLKINDTSITYNSTLEATIINTPGTAESITMWDHRSSGYFTAAIFADTLWVANMDGFCTGAGWWTVVVRDPATDFRQIFTISAADNAKLTLTSSWNGNGITNAQVVPYGHTGFNFLTPPYIQFNRGDSSSVYDAGGFRLQ